MRVPCDCGAASSFAVEQASRVAVSANNKRQVNWPRSVRQSNDKSIGCKRKRTNAQDIFLKMPDLSMQVFLGVSYSTAMQTNGICTSSACTPRPMLLACISERIDPVPSSEWVVLAWRWVESPRAFLPPSKVDMEWERRRRFLRAQNNNRCLVIVPPRTRHTLAHSCSRSLAQSAARERARL